MQKPIKFGLVILSSVVVILIIAMAVSGIPKKPDAQAPTLAQPAMSGQISVKTDVWQTYRNDNYGFEFEYPKDLRVQVQDFTEGAPGGVIFGMNVGENIIVNVAKIEKGLRNETDPLSEPNGMDPVSSKDMMIAGLKGRTYILFEAGNRSK